MQFGLQSTLIKKISRRYARALLGLALEKKTLEEVYVDVQFLTATLKSSVELKDFVVDPHHPDELLRSVLDELFKNKIQQTTFDFLMFLIEKGRLNILNEIISAFTLLYLEEHKIGTIEIISASTLLPEQVEAIRKRLTVRWKREFVAETRIDPALIGGFQIKAGDQVLDYSIKNQLENFRRQIINA